MKIDFGGVRQPNRSNEPTRTSDDLALPVPSTCKYYWKKASANLIYAIPLNHYKKTAVF
ncbi:hypothetical protein Bca101_032841 [Brassica carinata]